MWISNLPTNQRKGGEREWEENEQLISERKESTGELKGVVINLRAIVRLWQDLGLTY